MVAVTLTLTGRAAASEAAVNVSDSADFHGNLTPAELRQGFGAPTTRVKRVTAWARTAGFTTGPIDATGVRLPITAAAAAWRRWFGVTLTESVVGGAVVRQASQPHLPAALHGLAAAVSDPNPQPARPMSLRSCIVAPRQGATVVEVAATNVSCLAAPSMTTDSGPTTERGGCTTVWDRRAVPVTSRPYLVGNVWAPLRGYTGTQLRSLYGLAGSDSGAGQTVVIVGAYDDQRTHADASTTFARAAHAAPPVEDIRHVTAGIVGRPATAGPWGGYLVRVDSGTQQAGPGWAPVTGLGAPGWRFVDAA
ncbi:protease pro-enzyme activation domain-containing protein [Actinoplanes sp. NPDC026619]|uniref:protease pro-enzyme activation domain-containing protein n=1 Tax=Actinoplanes sp. NPDC026619 TaxID=3155798 RepID=UPI0033D600CD